MYETFPKGKKSVPSVGKNGRHTKSQETGSPYQYRQSITAAPEKRTEQVYSGQYGKGAPAARPDNSGIMVSPRKTMIGIG